MPVRFLISTLKAGVDPAEYEKWVRERDYELVRTLPNFVSYKVHRIRRPIQGAENAGWQYIERIEVKSLEQHDKDLASPAGVKLREELYGRYLDRSKNIYFASDTIE
jgi:REDY-like protein HapK